MNLPNKLTIFRVILVIPFVALMLNGYDLWAVAVFIIASLTDLLDGKIARKYNLITDFGKFMDRDCYHQQGIYHQRFPSGGF